jgi:hypothetical protein
LVYPGDNTVPSSLACYDNCLAAFSSNGVDPNNPFHSTWNYETGMSTQVTYSFDSTSGMLQDGIYSVVSTTTGGANMWGFNTGALFDPGAPNLANLLDCNWDMDNSPATNPQTCGWKAWSALPVFYTWETGPNSWNQFVALKDLQGNMVAFEAPLQVAYQHHQPDTNAPDRAFDGNTFMLDYSGFGQLNGIPSFCVDMDSGDKIDCSMSNGSNAIRWVPQFTIPMVQLPGSPNAGDLTTMTDSSGIVYLVKPLEIEQRMKAESDGTVCNMLAATNFDSYTLPSFTIFTTDSFFTNTAANHPLPANVPAAPAVMGGVMQ